MSWRRATLRFSRRHTTLKARTALGLKSTSRSTRQLRRCLDSAGAKNVPIFYSLAVSYEVFRTVEERQAILDQLKGVPIDSLWIKVSQGGALTHAAVRHLVKGAVDLHSLGVPLVGDMMAGCAGSAHWHSERWGASATGSRSKERFNARSWTRTESSGNQGFTWAPRIYVALLDMHLKRSEAEAFFEARGSKSRFDCGQRNCCPKGVKDMLDNPVRHSLVQRRGGNPAVERCSRTPSRTAVSRGNSAPGDGCGGVLGVAVVRRGRPSGQTDEPEQEGCRAPPGWLGEFRAGESGRFVLEDTPASGATRLRPDPSREVRYQ